MTTLRALFVCAALWATCQAGIEEHFKPALDKGTNHQMRNIDFIYVINLDQRPEKFALCKQQLNAYGIEPYRFSAVNGWELSLETINELGVVFEPWMQGTFWGTSYLPQNQGQPHHEILQTYGQTYFCHRMSRGAIGICLSHLSVLQDAYDSEYETIWVKEDDIEVIRNPHLISDLIDEMNALEGKGGWDVLFTDRDTKSQKGEYVSCTGYAKRPNFTPGNNKASQLHRNISQSLRQIGARYGAYSMVVQRSGMEKILNFFKTYKLFLPYDMDFLLPPGIRLFALRDGYDIVSTQPRAPSDNSAPNYLNAQP